MAAPGPDTQLDTQSHLVAVASDAVTHSTGNRSVAAALRYRIGSMRKVPKRKGGAALDALDLGLNALKNAGPATQVPFMREAAGILLQLVNTIQAVRDNQDAFKRLTDQAKRIVLAVSGHLSPAEITPKAEESLEGLHTIITHISDLAVECTKRRWMMRLLAYKSDVERLKTLREELDNATRIFDIDIAMINHQFLAQLSERLSAQAVPSSPNPPENSPLSPPVAEAINDRSNPVSLSLAADNIGKGTQITSGINIMTNTDGNIMIMNSFNRSSPSAPGTSPSHPDPNSDIPRTKSPSLSSSSSIASREVDPPTPPSEDHEHLRASPCPSAVELPHENVNPNTASQPPHESPHPSISQLPTPTSSSPSPASAPAPQPPRGRLTPSQPHLTRGRYPEGNSTSNDVQTSIKATNRGSGTQVIHGINIGKNTNGNVTMNSGNVTTTTVIGSHNDYSVRYANGREPGGSSRRWRGRYRQYDTAHPHQT